jgi:hypothetical protein
MQNIKLPPSSMRALEVAVLFSLATFPAKTLTKAVQLWVYLVNQDSFPGWLPDLQSFGSIASHRTSTLLHDLHLLNVYAALPLVLTIRRLALFGLLTAETLAEHVTAAESCAAHFVAQAETLTPGQKGELKKLLRAARELRRGLSWEYVDGPQQHGAAYAEQPLYGQEGQCYAGVGEHPERWQEGWPQGWEFGHGAEGEWVHSHDHDQEGYAAVPHYDPYTGAEWVGAEDSWGSYNVSPSHAGAPFTAACVPKKRLGVNTEWKAVG